MSYDITIAADDRFSGSTDVASVSRFIAGLLGITPNGSRGFVLDVGGRLWMEIDLESVSDEGDVEDDSDSSPTINCIRLHIPEGRLGNHPEQDYFPTASRIARHLAWIATDDQTGDPLLAADVTAASDLPTPWWRFW